MEITEAAPKIKAGGPIAFECTRKARQRLERHRASLELDRLLDVYPYPDPVETYGATAALYRFLHEVVS